MNIDIQPAFAGTAEPSPKTVSAFDKCQPLPPHFGTINPGDAFDAERFFIASRCNGCRPFVQRDDGVVYFGQRGHQFDLQSDRSDLQKHCYAALTAWSTARDPDHTIRDMYIAATVQNMPSGDFYQPLG